MKHIIVIFIALMGCLCVNAEVRIHMEKEAGVYKVPCQVNGLEMKFIFDTGAANVCISLTYAEMMLKNGYLNDSDFKGTSLATLADGSVIDNLVVNLRRVKIGGQTIENVTAIVVPTQNAPLLLGQSVIQRLGKVSIDGDYLVIHNANIYTEKEIAAIYEKAEDLYQNKIYSEALKYYQIVYEFCGEDTNPWVLYSMGICYSNLKDRESAERCHLKAIELDNGENQDGILFDVYSKLASIFHNKKDYNRSLEYSLMMQRYAIHNKEKAEAFVSIACGNWSLEKYTEALFYSNKAINAFNLLLKKRKLDSYEAEDYVYSYFCKGCSLEELRRYQEAIEAFTMGKNFLENNKDEEYYQDYIDTFNLNLSLCYEKLANH